MEDKKHCDECDCKMNKEDPENEKIHNMTHMLINQLNKMPSEYGYIAMQRLLIEHSLLSKKVFLERLSDLWDILKGKE